MEVPLPPKSHSAITPRVGSPGSACSAVGRGRGVGDQQRLVGGPLRDAAQRPPQRLDGAGRQCAGWVMAVAAGSGRPAVAA